MRRHFNACLEVTEPAMNYSIPLVKPIPPKSDTWIKYLEESYESNTFCNYGPAVSLFQKRLQEYTASNYPPVSVCNATLGLEVALLALEIQHSEVLIPTFTFAATAHSVERAGATPVFVDSVENTWHMNLWDAETKLTKDTRALVVVHPFGMLTDIRDYQIFAKTYNLALIFDSAAAFGAIYPGTTFRSNSSCKHSGEIEIFSFHVTKTMGIGEGAAIFANDPQFLERCRRTANFGFNDDAMVAYSGTNAKMSDFQAAVGLAKLDELDQSLYSRRAHAEYYNSMFRTKAKKVIPQNLESRLEQHCYPFYPIRFSGDTAQAKLRLNEKKIGFRQYYQPLHSHPYFKEKYIQSGGYPVADSLAKSVFCLPCYESLTITNMEEVIEAFS